MKLFFFVSFFFYTSAFGQKIASDSVKISTHTPKKAALLSMLIPGSGQIYNQIYSPKGRYGAYWKVPLIYASLIGTGSLFLKAIQTEKEIKTEYYNREQNSSLISPKWINYSASDLILLHESALKKRTMYGILFFGVYAIQAIEASIDAHFLHFDISPSITMHIQPTYYYQTAGIQLRFDLN